MFGGSVYSWSSGSEVTLWVMAGILFLSFGLTRAFNPLVDAQHQLYPTMFLRRPVMMMLQLAIFMSSVSLLVGQVIRVLETLAKARAKNPPRSQYTTYHASTNSLR